MQRVDHRQVAELMAQGAQLVDTLPAHEFRSAHIAGAIHLPLDRLFREAGAALGRQRPVIVYCRDAL